MAIYPLGQNTMDGVGHLGCDEASDVANLPDYAKSQNLKPGTDCLCVNTSDVYVMKSDGTFKKL